MPVSINTQIKQGSTYFKEITLKSEDQSKILDLTGAQVMPYIKSILGVVYYVDVEMVDAKFGKIKIKMPAYKTRAVNSGRYEFYINATLADGTVVSSVTGIAEVEGVLPATVKQETRDVSFQRDIVVAYNSFFQGDANVYGRLKIHGSLEFLDAVGNFTELATMEMVSGAIKPVNDKVVALQQYTNGLDVAVSSLRNLIQTNSEDDVSVRAEVDAIQLQAAGFDTRIVNLETLIQVNTTNDSVTADKINLMDIALNGVVDKSNSNQTAVMEHETEITNLQTGLNTVQQQQTTNDGRLGLVESSVNQNQQIVVQNTANISALQSQLNDANATIAGLVSRIEALEAKP